jgi:cytochrome c oxidase assembly protein subunit 15
MAQITDITPSIDASDTAAGKAARARPAVVVWLFTSAAMVAAMIVIGGITRLTESGLSMVEWRPLIGWVPPLNDAEWGRVFDLYKLSPQYQQVNGWMDLEAFKTIFFWEYVHRVWGRLIGIVFAVPLAIFLITGRIERSRLPRLVLLLGLGGLQGAIGWWMVTSGLADEAMVSPYRLATHLSMAFLIFGLLIWTALDIRAVDHPSSDRAGKSVRIGAGHILAFIALTIVAGAFVAGNDAGFDYNTFPLMDGRFVPEGYWDLGIAGLIENVPTVQFNHRWIAITTAALTLGFAVWARPRVPASAALPITLLGAMVVLQALVGIVTLLAVVPVWLGALHQGGAVVLFGLAVWTRFAVRAE